MPAADGQLGFAVEHDVPLDDGAVALPLPIGDDRPAAELGRAVAGERRTRRDGPVEHGAHLGRGPLRLRARVVAEGSALDGDEVGALRRADPGEQDAPPLRLPTGVLPAGREVEPVAVLDEHPRRQRAPAGRRDGRCPHRTRDRCADGPEAADERRRHGRAPPAPYAADGRWGGEGARRGPGRDDGSRGRRTEQERTGGQRTEGERAEGERTGGERTGGERTGGERTGGERTGGERTGGERTGGERTGGERTGG